MFSNEDLCSKSRVKNNKKIKLHNIVDQVEVNFSNLGNIDEIG